MVVKTFDKYKDNGALIAACAQLGYLKKEWLTLDPTYGQGTFWNAWQPDKLIATDIDPDLDCGQVDFTKLPWDDELMDACVFDPPYKLNGKPDKVIDKRYGVHQPTRWQDRMKLIEDGAAECFRVTKYNVLVKCQDQVVSGKKRWQTDMVTEVARLAGFGKVDRLDIFSYRKQDPKRGQKHAHSVSSQLMVFKRGW